MIGSLSKNMMGMEVFDVIVAKNIEMAEARSKGKRKTRRGKKKRDGPYYSDMLHRQSCKSENELPCENCVKNYDLLDFDTKDGREGRRRRNSRQLLRPRYSPKAPHNSTQFIMDGYFESHDQSLYTSLDSPCPMKIDNDFGNHSTISNTSIDSDYGLDSLFRDNEVDFTDTVAYMEQDFESAYRDARIEELSKMSKSDLLSAILDMEQKAERLEKELEQSVINSNPTKGNKLLPRFVKMGHLAKLQDENIDLKTENDNIRLMLDCC